MSKEEKKKKEKNVEKVENCITYRDGEKVIVGFPTEVETRAAAGGRLSFLGGDAKGEKYTKVKYDWKVISGSPLPKQEMEEYRDKITTSSGTLVSSITNVSSFDGMAKCRKCGTPIFLVGEGLNCQKCGTPTV